MKVSKAKETAQEMQPATVNEQTSSAVTTYCRYSIELAASIAENRTTVMIENEAYNSTSLSQTTLSENRSQRSTVFIKNAAYASSSTYAGLVKSNGDEGYTSLLKNTKATVNEYASTSPEEESHQYDYISPSDSNGFASNQY